MIEVYPFLFALRLISYYFIKSLTLITKLPWINQHTPPSKPTTSPKTKSIFPSKSKSSYAFCRKPSPKSRPPQSQKIFTKNIPILSPSSKNKPTTKKSPSSASTSDYSKTISKKRKRIRRQVRELSR